MLMAAKGGAEARRLYSWWWDSHISPKNSKWLQQNLADIDDKVKTMIRIIEDDAESFAQRAEMFYRNRPELMKLVEEFYRAYRALAERYDHATGALRQAHRKMAEAFPSEIPLEFSEEPPGPSSTLFEPDGLRHDFVPLQQQDDAMFGGEAVCSEHKSLQEEVSRLPRENRDLSNQTTSESLRADKAESEAQRLKETFAKLKTDKEALTQYEECKSRVSYLENELSKYQTDLKKLKDDMLMRVESFSSVKEKSNALEKANRSLTSELGMLKQKLQEQQKDSLVLDKANQTLNFEVELLRKKLFEQQEELNMKEGELEKLKISLKDEHECRMLAEITRQSIEKHLAECREKERILEIEMQSEDQKLKDIQISRLSLEEELHKLKKENGKLNEEKLLSALKVINLQDEIIALKNSVNKLKDALDVHVKEKTALQDELCRLIEDRKDLEDRYNVFREEIQSVNSSVQSLPAMIRDLRDKNLELKESITEHKHKDKYTQDQQLMVMVRMSEKNSILERSVSDANKELGKLREKISALEDSSYELHGRISIHQAEKAMLISQSESAYRKMKELSKKNAFFENSLYDMNYEFDDLKGKLKSLEESYRSLREENLSILSENTTLVSQVESISQCLKNLEDENAELRYKYTDAETQKNSTLQQAAELQELLRQEKEKHSALIQKSKLQLDAFMSKIHVLLEGSQKWENELEEEQHKTERAQTIISAFQRCFSNIREEIVLSTGLQKHQGTLRLIERLVLDLEQEFLGQEKYTKSTKEKNQKLSELIHVIAKVLKLDQETASSDGVKDELLLHLILREIRQLLHTVTETQDEKQHILLEKTVVITLLEQFGAYTMDLRKKVTALEIEPNRAKELFLLKKKNDKLLEINEHLSEEVEASNQREEALKAEVDVLFLQLSHLQDDCCSFQNQFPKMLEQNSQLEEENRVVLSEVVALDYLSLMLKNCIAERVYKLESLSTERNCLLDARNDLQAEIQVMNKKIDVLEADNAYMKESVAKLEDKNLRAVHDDGKAPLENLLNFPDLETEDARLHEEEASEAELSRPQEDVAKSIFEAEKRIDDVKFSDAGINSSLNIIQFNTINSELFKAKIHELMKTCQSLERNAMVQKKILQEEIVVRDLAINELKQKIIALEGENRELMDDLNAFLVLLRSLWDDVSILEEHTISLARRHSSLTNPANEDIHEKFLTKRGNESCENDTVMALPGLEKLQILHAKVKSLQKVVMETEGLLELQRWDSSASFDVAWKEIEWLMSRRVADSERIKHRQVVNDAQPDNSSDFLPVPYELKKTISITEIPNPALEVSDINKVIYSHKKEKRPLAIKEKAISHNQMENMEVDDYRPLQVVAVKELGVDKLVLPKKLESNQEWNRTLMERLASDGHRLLLLQAHLRELEKNIEVFRKVNHHPMNFETDSVNLRLKETAETISKLMDINNKLTRKFEDLTSGNQDKEKKESSRKSQQISDRAIKVSQKIGKLEMELQKIQTAFIKADEERIGNRTSGADKRSGMLVKEYINAKRDSLKQKKGSPCGCIRPKTSDD